MSKCVRLDNIRFKYDTIFDFGVKFDIFGFAMFGDICFNIYLKKDVFKSCFQQSAKGKMTALNMRKCHVVVQICHLDCMLQSKLRFPRSDPFCVRSD